MRPKKDRSDGAEGQGDRWVDMTPSVEEVDPGRPVEAFKHVERMNRKIDLRKRLKRYEKQKEERRHN